jgi:transcriptional regulator with XRE-family HTH domain
MNAKGFRRYLERLGLTQTEAANLLSVDPRTVRRWAEEGDNAIPGPAEHALRAWAGLQREGVPWRPEDIEDAQQVALHRQHAIELYELLMRVEARGGPRLPWKVDVDNGVATLGDAMRLSFYRLRNGGFSPAYYRRSDQTTDIERDRELIEDGFACIARAVAAQRKPMFFGASLQNDSVVLWDFQRVPTIAMKIPCELVRRMCRKNPDMTEEQCRFVADCNKELLAELAGILHGAGRYRELENKITVIEPTAMDLKSISNRFSTSALDLVPMWADPVTGRTSKAIE